ncbi:MAG: type II toxin-antitoxin system RelE/ParE family toxin [Gammaproteobacteria bacterium]|nr:MAG: type II toxin-antitoxin system RelE/ParE family toxin [Gammaproteobacteria bacterium]
MRVYRTLEARARLLEIQAYIAQNSPAAARKAAARLVRRSRQLATPPLVGRRLPEYPETELRELLERPFRIIYAVKPGRVEIITLKHYRQRLPRNPRRLARR